MVAVLVGRAELDKDAMRGAAGLDGMDGSKEAALTGWEHGRAGGGARLGHDSWCFWTGEMDWWGEKS